MSRVLVLSPQRIPLAPCTPARARWLLSQKKAAVLRRFPFTLVLVQEPSRTSVPPIRLKIDPGSKTTGLALVNDATGQVIWAGELTHRGQQVREGLQRRRACRRSRRQRHTRYRARRFDNRRRRDGWLPPSLESRMANLLTWVTHLCRCCPVGAISLELVKFDTQLLQNPEITSVAYQQGELAGYEIRQYLLEKFGHRCAYCGTTTFPWRWSTSFLARAVAPIGSPISPSPVIPVIRPKATGRRQSSGICRCRPRRERRCGTRRL